MTLQALIDVCGFETVCVPDGQVPVMGAYTSDLLSDVMAHCPEAAVLITVQNHRNAVAVSTLVGAAAILIVHHRDIPEEMLDLARGEGVALLRTPENQFEASCRIGAVLSETDR